MQHERRDDGCHGSREHCAGGYPVQSAGSSGVCRDGLPLLVPLVPGEEIRLAEYSVDLARRAT
jgi:hypothetical protein